LSASPSIRLVVFDWAGTTVDHGCRAPVAAFVEVFRRHGVAVTDAQARGPMGLHKRDHIAEMLRVPEVASAWRQVHGADADEADIRKLYEDFIPLQMETIEPHSGLVPGVVGCVEALRREGVRIAGTTGYFRAAAELAAGAARRQGYVPDVNFCAEDVPKGRPAPWMIFRCMEGTGVYPPSAVLKVGDTMPDIEEGLNAGCWSVGVIRASSEVGLSEAEVNALPREERRARFSAARAKLRDPGAHEVLDGIAEVPELVARLNARLGRGEKP
jgi:phosphonoacetaldehyde hydrolase